MKGADTMKRLICVGISLILTFGMSFSAFAKEQECVSKKVVNMGDELKIEVVEIDTGKIFEVPLIDCTKTIEVFEYDDDTIHKKVTVGGVFELPGETSISRTPRENTDCAIDNGYAFKATLTIGFDEKPYWDGGTSYLITYVEGEWENLDNAFSIYDKTYSVSCFAGNSLAGIGQQDLDIPIDDDEYSFSFETNYDEYAPVDNDPTSFIGAKMQGYISRNQGYEYLFIHKNMIED